MADENRPADENQAGENQPEEQTIEHGGEQGTPAEEMSQDQLLLTLQDARDKADEYWNQLLRSRAELSNMQRRAERDLENAHKYGLEKFARDLLPIIDSLEMALAATGDDDQAESPKLREGIELTTKMFLDVVGKYGLEVINPALGDSFNPEFHQAMSTQPSADVAPNSVITVYQKGYLLNDRLVRPAMVVVSAAGNNAQGDGNGQKIDEMA